MNPLEPVLRPRPARTFADAEAFWRAHVEDVIALAAPVDRAIAGGALADRLGYAFVAGYSAALQALVDCRDPAARLSLAATEEGGAHPRAIRTRLERAGDGWTLTGEKAWVTLGSGALLVLASKGQGDDGRAQLVVVKVAADAPGATRFPQTELPFVPEVLHAKVVLDHVRVSDEDVLPGDGWERWVKPFRTVEDVHVHAAVLGYLGATAGRHGWPRALREQLAACVLGVRALAAEDASSPLTHVALGGVIAQSRALVEACVPHWGSVPQEERERWERDRLLLEVAGKARTLRLERGWQSLEGA